MLLTLNAGSSSLKFQLINPKTGHAAYKGMVDRLATSKSSFSALTQKKSIQLRTPIKTIEEALEIAIKIMWQEKILRKNQLEAVVHRVVHGGEKYTEPRLITPKITQAVKKLCELAPLHNRYNLDGIKAAQKLLKNFPHIAVFDTGFYKTLPKKAFLYAVPLHWYRKFHIRRYGFHGISHEYVTKETLKILKKKTAKIITCHLGNGCSITASFKGKAMDTSMGFTPLEGIPMGTRSGDIDPSILPYLTKKLKKSAEEIERLLNKESGLKALAGVSDMRDIWKKVQQKNTAAIMALEIFSYRIAKYIGAFTVILNGLDAITFTGGIGENAAYIRKAVCEYLTFLGIHLDPEKNQKNAAKISSAKSKIPIFAIKTNEELEMAKKAENLIKKLPPRDSPHKSSLHPSHRADS